MLCLIPARGGSKSIPGKNLANLAGRPLIVHTISAALAASTIERVVVSTDSPEIAKVAHAHGAQVPFMRPTFLAQDETAGIESIIHAVEWLADNEGYKPEWIACLQPTSPLRRAEDIDEAMRLALKMGVDAVVSITPTWHHPYHMHSIDKQGILRDYQKFDRIYSRRQDLPTLYAQNGAVFLIRRNILLDQQTLFPKRTYGYVMPAERSLDIDTPWDFYLARLILADRDQQILQVLSYE